MCRIKFEETFRMNVGLPDLSKKGYLIKPVILKEKIVKQKIIFFRKVRETDIHPKNLIKFDIADFGI